MLLHSAKQLGVAGKAKSTLVEPILEKRARQKRVCVFL